MDLIFTTTFSIPNPYIYISNAESNKWMGRYFCTLNWTNDTNRLQMDTILHTKNKTKHAKIIATIHEDGVHFAYFRWIFNSYLIHTNAQNVAYFFLYAECIWNTLYYVICIYFDSSVFYTFTDYGHRCNL